MLASTAADVAEAIADLGLSSVEWKLDGIRIQVHTRATRCGSSPATSTTSPTGSPRWWPSSGACRPTEVVLDGEALTLTEDAAAAALPGHDEPVRPARPGEPERPPVGARFFDFLHLDGEDLLDRPLLERLAALERVAGPWRIPGQVTDDPAAAEAVLPTALAAGHEGVVVKAARRPPTRPAGGASRGARSRWPAPSTSSCSAPSGATAAARAGCRTCTSAPATRQRGLRHGGQDVQGPDRRHPDLADRAVPGAGDPPGGDHRVRPPRAGGGDRPRRRADVDPLPRRRGPPLRPGQALPPRQVPARGRHHRLRPGPAHLRPQDDHEDKA